MSTPKSFRTCQVATQRHCTSTFLLHCLLLTSCRHDSVSAFTLSTTCRSRPFTKHTHDGSIINIFARQSSTELSAKPPPLASFDLDAIEEFERSLLNGGNAKNNVEDLELDSDEGTTTTTTHYTVTADTNNKRIDAVLATLMAAGSSSSSSAVSRSTCGNLVSDGHVFLQGEDNERISITRKSERVKEGQVIVVVSTQDAAPTEILPEELPLDVIYEDEHMIVLNKAAGMVVHPAAGNWDGTLVNALAYYLANESPFGSGEFVEQQQQQQQYQETDVADGEIVFFRPGIVHRLDKGTTGVIIVAKTKLALANLSASFAQRKVRKTYLAITVGNPGKKVVIDKPIGRHPIHRQKMRVVPDPSNRNRVTEMKNSKNFAAPPTSVTGRRALSFVNTQAFDGRLSVAQVRIETGRTHQIRVHLQDRRTPIYGDDIYGIKDWNRRLEKTQGIVRPLLHAHRIEIDHPVTGEKMVLTAPMDEGMSRVASTIWPQGREERPEFFKEER